MASEPPSKPATGPTTGVAVIGYGEWGPNHVRVFREQPEAGVVAVVDRDADRRSAVARRYPDLDVHEDPAAVFEDPRVEAVVVATPTASHFDLCRHALSTGRHVLCEKPLTISARDSQELADLAHTAGRVLSVGHVFLHNPGILKLKELLSTGHLGEIHFLRSVRTNLGPIRQDVNSLYDLASHDISIFNYLLDARPIRVSPVGQSFLRATLEDMAVLTLTCPGRVLATAFVSWLDPRKVRITGDAGWPPGMTWPPQVRS